MLTVIDAIRQRRSIRSFRSDPVPDEAIQLMLEAARLAPSGSNRQPWRFIAVTEAETKARLRRICFDQDFIEEAPLVFVCCADLTAYTQASRKKRYQEFIDYGVIDTMSGRFADPVYRASLLAAPDPDFAALLTPAIANTYIAIEHIVLTATALGLGTCWVGALGKPGEIETMLRLPPTTVVATLLPTGYPTRVPPPRPRQSLEEILVRPLPVVVVASPGEPDLLSSGSGDED